MKTTLTRLFMPVAFASLTGCATTQMFDADTCQTWTQSDNSSALFNLFARSASEQKFSNSCHEGRIVAQAVLNNRAPDGRLHPVSAYIATKFLQIKEDEIRNGINAEYNQDVLRKFYFYSGLSKKDINESLEQPTQKNQTPSPEKLAEEKIPDNYTCARQGLRLVCGLK